MQRIDFVNTINNLVEKLESRTITNIFDNSFSVSDDNTFNYALITPYLFASKSNYDFLLMNKVAADLLIKIGAPKVYDSVFLANLSRKLTQTQTKILLKDASFKEFWAFHYSLVKLAELAENLLVADNLLEDSTSQLDEGIILFRIINKEQGLDADIFADIFSTLKELIVAIEKINGNESHKAEVVFLDSGSDTNLAIKTTAETAKSVFLIFKEMWDFFKNKSHYEHKQKLQSITESLSVMEDIKKKEEAGVLSSDDAKELAHYVKTRTDKLIGLNVAPKYLLDQNDIVTGEKILDKMKETRLLSSSNERSADESVSS